ncbi:MAG: DUF2085 domain-containing protein [Bacteroidota bacterium]|nr:DUF2085 domain-containing protein [Bacteroidota bacterium]
MLGIFIVGFSIVAITNNPHIKIYYPYLKLFYSKICHQIPYKSIEVNGFHFLVCARCTGIYAGAFLSSLFFLLAGKIRFNVNLRFLLLFLPMIVDIFSYKIGLYNYSKIVAFFTGLPAGFMVVSVIISIFASEFFNDLKNNDL